MKVIILFVIYLFLSEVSYADIFSNDIGVPKSIPQQLEYLADLLDTSLPTKLGIPQKVLNKAYEILLTVGTYQDSVDKDKYYVIPVFRSVSNEPAASLIINTRLLNNIDKLEEAMDGYKGSAFMKRIKILNDAMVILTRLQFAIKDEDENAITDAQREQARKLGTEVETSLQELKTKYGENSGLSNTERSYYLDKILRYSGKVGIPMTESDLTDAKEYSKKFLELELGYAGSFTANIQAKLQDDAVASLRIYAAMCKAKDHPTPKFASIPVKQISWRPLTQLGINGTTGGIPIYRNMQGGGNLGGATINADLTVGGADAFGIYPSPVILPIAAYVSIPMKHPSFTIRLVCDFENFAKAKLRSDQISMGWLFNGDLYQDFFDDSKHTGACKTEITGGAGTDSASEREIAFQKSIEAIKSRLQGVFFEQVQASKQRIADLHNSHAVSVASAPKPHGSTSWWSNLFGASSWGWHTTKQQMESLASLHFKDEITYSANDSTLLDIPMTMCVAYNMEQKAYYSCSYEESKKARPLQEVADKIYKKCKANSTDDRDECRENRLDNAKVDEKTSNIADPNQQSSTEIDMGEGIGKIDIKTLL